MNRVKLVISALAIVATSGFGSYAADSDLVIPAIQEDAYTPVEIGSGWYIRGDVGYSKGSQTGGSYLTYDDLDPDPLLVANGYSTEGYDKFNFKSAKELSFGVGYTFNSILRADITANYSKRNVNGSDFYAGYLNDAGDRVVCGNVLPAASFLNAVGCRTTDTTGVSAIEVMANAYADLGTYSGFTPYVGAGVGVTRLKFNSLTNSSSCVDPAGLAIPGCGAPTDVHSGEVSTRLSYALMAGTAYNLSKNLKLDVGYRYSAIQGGNMFGFDASTKAVGASGVQGTHGTLSTHQIKAGLRYEIW